MYILMGANIYIQWSMDGYQELIQIRYIYIRRKPATIWSPQIVIP